MPKELIGFPDVRKLHHNCLPGEGCPPGCEVVAESWPQVSVRWANAGHDRTGNVQISLVEYNEIPWEEYVARLEKAVAERDAVRNVDLLGEAKETYSMVLSRSELNDLIRVLRRARNQAYGADE